MSEFLMPKLGADMTAGRLVTWYKKPGEVVKRGDIVAEVETEKGNIDVEIFSGGVIEKLLIQPGQTVPIGTPLAILRDEQEAQATTAAAAEQVTVPLAPREIIAPMQAAQPKATRNVGRLQLTPAARRRARELGIDVAALAAAGRDGVFTLDDIEDIARRATTTAPVIKPKSEDICPKTELDRFARMRQTIAAAMARSKREIPHYYLGTKIDMDASLHWMTERNQSRSVTERLLSGVLIIKAVALALKEIPELNAVWDGDRVVTKPDINVGVAISIRQGGLVAPALHHADQLTLDELMANFRDLVNRARAGSLRSSELSDPTITITNLGDQGVEAVFGIIYPPQVALVGVGKVSERPCAVEGQIVSRPIVTATLSGDHRATDGHRGALFLAAVNRLLQEPSKL